LLLTVAAALATPRFTLANPIISVTLQFESEGIDLDTGTVVPVEPWTVAEDLANPQPDMVLAYNSEREVRAVVFHNRTSGVEIAFLDGVPFNLVDSADLAGLSFSAETVDEPFEPSDSVVIRTDKDAYYLVGSPIEHGDAVTFDTQLLDVAAAGLARSATDDDEGSAATDDQVVVSPSTTDSPVVHETTKLTASDAEAGDFFGASVAVSGDQALAGAFGEDLGDWRNAGAAYLFRRG
jgi:hypothetical protein